MDGPQSFCEGFCLIVLHVGFFISATLFFILESQIVCPFIGSFSSCPIVIPLLSIIVSRFRSFFVPNPVPNR